MTEALQIKQYLSTFYIIIPSVYSSMLYIIIPSDNAILAPDMVASTSSPHCLIQRSMRTNYFLLPTYHHSLQSLDPLQLQMEGEDWPDINTIEL